MCNFLWDNGATKKGEEALQTTTDTLINSKQLAEWLNVHPGLPAQWRLDDRGPNYLRLGGRAIRYRVSDVAEWMAQNQQSPNGAA